MCEITTNNFNDFYHQIEQDIKQSKFIAIDTEFSGLSTSDNATTRSIHIKFFETN